MGTLSNMEGHDSSTSSTSSTGGGVDGGLDESANKGSDRKQRRRIAQPATASVHPSRSLVPSIAIAVPPSWRGKKGRAGLPGH